MFGNTFGTLFKITTAGESYSGAFENEQAIPQNLKGGLVVIVDGVPSGIEITTSKIQQELDKRRPGQSEIDTPRKEEDKAYILTGVMKDSLSTGAPVAIYIPNNTLSTEHIEKHLSYEGVIRPGQATYGYFSKYGKNMDWLGAGRASGRETAARVAGGAIAGIILEKMGIDVISFVSSIHKIDAGEISYEMAKQNYRKNELNCPDLTKASEMIETIKKFKDSGDSCGGIVEVIARGIPKGLGEPVFDKLDAMLSHALMSIGAIKGIEFGEGFGLTRKSGFEANDVPYIVEETGKVRFKTNRSGGVLGGISIGEDLRIRLAIKPTPTILTEQDSVDLGSSRNIKLKYKSRNDPCICPRIYPVCEAMVKMVIVDALYMFYGYSKVQKLLGDDEGL